MKSLVFFLTEILELAEMAGFKKALNVSGKEVYQLDELG